MADPDLEFAADLCAYIDAGSSPFHVVAESERRLIGAGFVRSSSDSTHPGQGVLTIDGSLLAWHFDESGPITGFDIIGAHTDSPNLRVKPDPDRVSAGMRQVGVEVYGGALVNSWLDRDLGLSGRVGVRTGDTTSVRLLRTDDPIARIPQLAIHLDRQINETGLKLNRQEHLVPTLGIAAGSVADLRSHVAELVRSDPHDVLAWDLMFHDLTPSRVVGVRGDMIAASRIDNLLSCHVATTLLTTTAPTGGRARVIALFDHEEVGSVTAHGANSSWLRRHLEHLAAASGADMARVFDESRLLSLDNAHATHPNYADRHDPEHTIVLNAGPVLKVNANARYATDARTGAEFVLACAGSGVPLQRFVNRSDLACGSTIGPIGSSALGVPAVDVGAPQLAMHSARETCGSADPGYLRDAAGQWLTLRS